MNEFLTAESVVVILVLVTTLVAIVANRRRLPYTVTLVVIGLLIAIPTALETGHCPGQRTRGRPGLIVRL